MVPKVLTPERVFTPAVPPRCIDSRGGIDSKRRYLLPRFFSKYLVTKSIYSREGIYSRSVPAGYLLPEGYLLEKRVFTPEVFPRCIYSRRGIYSKRRYLLPPREVKPLWRYSG